MEKKMRVRVDESGKEGHPREIDHARSLRAHVSRGTDRRDAIATYEDHPPFARLGPDAVKDAGRTKQYG
jgi:hypothetical protein